MRYYQSKPDWDETGRLRHIGLARGEVAPAVLMPGDPGRCEAMQRLFAAPHFVGPVSYTHLQSLGKARQATFISVARQGLFFLPLIYTLPSLIGVLGVQCSQPIADLVTALACVPIVLLFFRQLNAQIAAMPREGMASPQGCLLYTSRCV